MQIILLGIGAGLSSYKSPSYTWQAFLLCMVTNISIPYRNVLLKNSATASPGLLSVEAEKEDARASSNGIHACLATMQRLCNLNGSALIWTSIMCIIFAAPPSASQYQNYIVAAQLGLCRTAYELASLFVLQRVDPVVHSSLDVLKRAGMTVVDLRNAAIHPVNVGGSLLAFCSLLWYKRVSKAPRSSEASNGGYTLTQPQRELVTSMCSSVLFWLAMLGMRVIVTSANVEPTH